MVCWGELRDISGELSCSSFSMLVTCRAWVVFRRGKNIMKSIFKDEGTRVAITACVDAFKEQWTPDTMPKRQSVLDEERWALGVGRG